MTGKVGASARIRNSKSGRPVHDVLVHATNNAATTQISVQILVRTSKRGSIHARFYFFHLNEAGLSAHFLSPTRGRESRSTLSTHRSLTLQLLYSKSCQRTRTLSFEADMLTNTYWNQTDYQVRRRYRVLSCVCPLFRYFMDYLKSLIRPQESEELC